MQLRIENAYPWRESMRCFALEAWLLSAASPVLPLAFGSAFLSAPVISLAAVWPAKMQRHYPRTEAELMAGTAIIMRPARPH
jgi:hypothetical protein